MKKQAWKDVSSSSGKRTAPSAGLTPRERVTEYLWEAQPVKYVSVSVLGEFGTNSQRVEQKKRETVWVRTKRIWKRDDFVARILSVGSSEMAGVRY